MPSPSAGCLTCKHRRIKCDERKPTCGRCTKSRRICVGASAARQAYFSIHIENVYASGETKRPRGPRSSLTEIRPQISLQTRALAYYLQYHMQTLSVDVPNVSAVSLPDSVSVWIGSGRKCSMVDLALSSIALASFARTQRHPPAAKEAILTYYHLLKTMQERVAQVGFLSLDEHRIDACLLTAGLMGRFEGIKSHLGRFSLENSAALLRKWTHHNGAVVILKVWNDNPGHKPATHIIKQSRRAMIRYCLLRNLPLPDWIMNGFRFGECGLELDFDRITVRMMSLHFALVNTKRENCLNTTTVEELNEEARDLDEAIRDWLAQMPSTCCHQQYVLAELDPVPRKYFHSSTIYSYASHSHSAVWGQYFATRLLISSTRLRILKLGRQNQNQLVNLAHEQQRLECITQLNTMADSLASTMPFCLERFTVDSSRQNSISLNHSDDIKPYLANSVVWPLTIASCVEGVDTEQQLWFRSELARLGRITGDSALQIVETDQRPVM